MTTLADPEYTLYSSPFSLYSMMARHTIQLGPMTHGAKAPQNITLKFINHRENENLREDYLHVNPKGQVPTMTGNVLEEPLTDSRSISLHLAKTHYPAMLPAQHAAVIEDLLERIHSIYGLSFSNMNPTEQMKQHNPSVVEDILKRTDLSSGYRIALQKKLIFHNENNAIAFQPAIVAKARDDLQVIFAEITKLIRPSDNLDEAEWIFGKQVGPTVLDSHLLPVVLRCLDAGNAELVPQQLKLWAMAKEKTPAWQSVMHGRPTQWNP